VAIPHDEDDAAIATAIIARGAQPQDRRDRRGRGSLEQPAFLRAHRCNLMQSHYLSAPLFAADYAALLREHPGRWLTIAVQHAGGRTTPSG